METNLTTVTNCRNCDKQHDISFQFCPHCGQKTDEELTVGVLFYNTISNYFSFDARFFRSFIPLMFKPGVLASRFIQGKRLLYLHPAQMYLFISVVFFFIISFTIRDVSEKADTALQNKTQNELVSDSSITALDSIQLQKTEKILDQIKNDQQFLDINDGGLKIADSILKRQVNNPSNIQTSFWFNEQKVDSLIEVGAPNKEIYKQMGMQRDAGMIQKRLFEQALRFYKDRGAGSIIRAFFDSIPIALFFLLPIFALILKLFHLKRGRFAYHLVFSFYYFSFLFTAFSILYGLNLLTDIPDWIDVLIILSTFFYLWFAIKNFYKQGWFLSFIKACMATFTYFIFLIPFSLLIAIIAFLIY